MYILRGEFKRAKNFVNMFFHAKNEKMLKQLFKKSDGKDEILSTPNDHTPPLSIVIALAEHPVLGGGYPLMGPPNCIAQPCPKFAKRL